MGTNRDRKRVVGFVDHALTLEPHLFFTLGSMLQQHGLHLVHVDSQTRGTEGAVEECAAQDFSAAIVWSKTNNPDRDRMRGAQQVMPIIAVDHALRNVETDVVGCDTFEAARTAVRHLAACGRKRIGLTGMIDHLDTTQDRIGGYLDGMFSCGLQPDVRDMIFCNTSGMPEADTSILERRLMDDDRPDALFVMQDSALPNVAKAIKRCALKVPADIAFVSLGTDEQFDVDSVQATTMAMDWMVIARGLAERTLHRIAHPYGEAEQISYSTDLVIRGSCGAPEALWSRKPCLPLASLLRQPPENIATAPLVPRQSSTGLNRDLAIITTQR
jgi:DNA-binding LacI/PurR family transcriptional regulator